MDGNNTKRDPMPDSGASVKEIIEFWDAHSLERNER